MSHGHNVLEPDRVVSPPTGGHTTRFDAMPTHFDRFARAMSTALAVAALAACAQLPRTGPTNDEIDRSAAPAADTVIQIVDVDDRVARRLLAQRSLPLFSDTLPEAASATPPATAPIGVGDTVEITLWEAPPATLFSPGLLADPRTVAAAGTTTLPPQLVDHDGFVTVPFAGRVRAAGQTPQSMAADIVARLRGKANQPEALVRVNRASSTVTVVGEVANSVRMPLTPSGERLLDALAAAGGVRQPVSKMTVQLTRGNQYQSLPLDVVIRDPKQNVRLVPGDVVTAIFQPLSYTALGATGKQEEISFEAQGISLAQALARAGGLIDNRASPQGVFVFRFEPQGALEWPRRPVRTTPEGLVPVVYRVDMRDPASFFVMQSFGVRNKDVLYVANAPAAELQKFLNLVFSVVFPVANLINATQ
jgi:polysaccharide export outer membrane protein